MPRLSVSQWMIVLGGLGYVVVAGVNTMPSPGEEFDAYRWLYDWSHLLLNSPGAQRLEQKLGLPSPPTGGAEQPKS